MTIFDKFRSFFGLPPSGGEPRTDFKNPIWGSDDDDDDDDELYHGRRGVGSGEDRDININVYSDPSAMHGIMSRQMQEMFRMFNGIFGDVNSMFTDERFDHFGSIMDIAPEAAPQEGSIRDHYLKPGYNTPNTDRHDHKQDINLDGKVSSEEIAGLLKHKDSNDPVNRNNPETNSTRGGPVFQTIITKSITKPDGTTETRRVIKDHLGNVEETVTTTQFDSSNPNNNFPVPHFDESFYKTFTSFWKIF